MAGHATPAVSLVLATRNRAASLARALETIDVACENAGTAIECLVVDNGSSDETPAMLAAWAQGHPERIVLSEPRSGKSHALNCALRAARGDVLVFTDDDVEVPPDWLRAARAFLDAHPEFAAAVGRVETPPSVTDTDLLSRAAYYRTLPLFDLGPAVRETHHLYGCNMAVRREVLARVGPFDERLGPGASGLHEDGDLARRIIRAGLRIGYMPDVVLYHIVEPTRLTDEYFRELHLRDARSRFVLDGPPRRTQTLARLAGAMLTHAWWRLMRNPVRAMRARGRAISHAEMVRLAAAVPLAHVLLVRTDHLGDMLFTLPMVDAIVRAHPTCRISILASAVNAEAARRHPRVDHVEIDRFEAKGSRLRGLRPLVAQIRALRCDAAVVVHPTPRLALALVLARVPIRVGTASRAYSLLFNRRIHEHRRRPPWKHESAHNVGLLRGLGIETADVTDFVWPIAPQEAAAAEAVLRAMGVDQAPVVVLHPGSAGSSLNWSPTQYAELGRRLTSAGYRVAVTGTAREAALTATVAQGIGKGALDLAGRFTLPQLAALLKRSRLYVGGSTGPTHLATAVGTSVIALYSPIRSALPRRWAPRGAQVRVLQPTVDLICPKCLGPKCPFFHCMERHLTVASVADAATVALADAARG